MEQLMRRWPLVPVILFLVAGLVNGGADLSGGWGLLMLGIPITLALVQVARPTRQGWRLAAGSFALLVVATVVIDLMLAAANGFPPMADRLTMVALFALQFGIPAGLLWLARPRGGAATA